MMRQHSLAAAPLLPKSFRSSDFWLVLLRAYLLHCSSMIKRVIGGCSWFYSVVQRLCLLLLHCWLLLLQRQYH